MVAVLRWLRDEPSRSISVTYLVSGDIEQSASRMRLLVGAFTDEIEFLNKFSLLAMWRYCRSRYVFFTHGLYGFMPLPKQQCVVNLWHGMPLKRVWGDLRGSYVPQCTWLLSTSKMFSNVQAAASGFSKAKIPAIGLPRNDLLFSQTKAVDAYEAAVREGVEQVLVFLPTYRKSTTGFVTQDGEESGSALAMSVEEVETLGTWLRRNNVRLLVKPHPMSVTYGTSRKIDERIWLISDKWLHDQGLTLYEALGRSDALITDISSVYVDYLSLRRPVIFFFPDFEKYRETRRFQLEPIEEWLVGPLCRNLSELLASLSCMGNLKEPDSSKTIQLNKFNESGAVNRLMELAGICPSYYEEI